MLVLEFAAALALISVSLIAVATAVGIFVQSLIDWREHLDDRDQNS